MKKFYLSIKIIIPFLICLIASLLLIYTRYPKIPILGYHSFTSSNDTSEFVMDINQFEEELKYLSKHHYKSLSLDELYDIYKNNKPIPRNSVVITFDDGYMSNYELAFPLMKKYNMKGVVFVIGYHVKNNIPNYMNEETLKKVKEEYPNIEIASHTYNLHIDGVTGKDKSLLEDDFDKMSEVIDTKYFAYPYGLYDDNIINVLKEKDYKMAFTFGPGSNHRRATLKDDVYTLPRLNISNNMPLWKFALRLKVK